MEGGGQAAWVGWSRGWGGGKGSGVGGGAWVVGLGGSGVGWVVGCGWLVLCMEKKIYRRKRKVDPFIACAYHCAFHSWEKRPTQVSKPTFLNEAKVAQAIRGSETKGPISS